MIYQKYRDNSQEHEEVNRILGVLQRNLDRNSGGQFGLPPSSKDPKRNQIRMLLDKHLQMKDEAKDFSQSMVFSPEKETFLSKQLSGENQEMLKGLADILSKFESAYDKNSCINDSKHSEIMSYQPSKGETLQFLQEDESAYDKNSCINDSKHSEIMSYQPSKGETLQFLHLA